MKVPEKEFTYQTIEKVLTDFDVIRIDTALNFRSDKFKTERESWCVATALRHLGLIDFQLFPEPDQAHYIDTHVKDPMGSLYQFQVTELHPLAAEPNEILKDALALDPSGLSKGYGSLKTEVVKLVNAALNHKNRRYSKANRATLNTLIYFNAPEGKADEACFAPTVILNPEIDFDLPALQQITTDFGSVIFLTGNSATIIKGDGLVPSLTA